MGLSKLLALAEALQKQKLCAKSSTKIIKMLQNPRIRATIEVELAVLVEFGEPIMKATFNLETNAPVATIVRGIVASLLAVTERDYPTPQVDAACASAAALLEAEPRKPAHAAKETEETQELAEDLAEKAQAVEALLVRTQAEDSPIA